MGDLVGPCIGVLVGLALISFREFIGVFLENSYQKFPKYTDGIKAFNIRFKVGPVFIMFLGIIVILFSVISFFKLW
jgi:hypothetical protein